MASKAQRSDAESVEIHRLHARITSILRRFAEGRISLARYTALQTAAWQHAERAGLALAVFELQIAGLVAPPSAEVAR